MVIQCTSVVVVQGRGVRHSGGILMMTVVACECERSRSVGLMAAWVHDPRYLNGQLGECSLRMPQWQHCAVLSEHGGWSTASRRAGRIGAADDEEECVMFRCSFV